MKRYSSDARIVVAGHVCLDIIPDMRHGGAPQAMLPGKLVNIGPATVATGGVVANVGVALRRLGQRVTLAGKVGDDLLGRAVLDVLSAQGRDLARGMIVARGESTSYTVVVSPGGADRCFLHSPGANDTFVPSDVPDSALAGACLLHFGYPPLMKRIYSDGGRRLASLLRRARGMGLATSLDVTNPDPQSESGRVDWAGLLLRVLPNVDIFAPSLEETLYMLDRPRLRRLASDKAPPDARLLGALGERLLNMGVAVAAIKLGRWGLYLRTADKGRLAAMGACAPRDIQNWAGREIISPCMRVKVVGTTGAGDCTVAGLLASLARGLGVEQSASMAVAVGACSVQQPDATSGVVSWTKVRRLMAGWKRARWPKLPPLWRPDEGGLYLGSCDQRALASASLRALR
jgi:sugar/nucleoside kinase (ribokinase family)